MKVIVTSEDVSRDKFLLPQNLKIVLLLGFSLQQQVFSTLLLPYYHTEKYKKVRMENKRFLYKKQLYKKQY